MLTCVVDQEVQSGLRPQEGLGEAAHGLQAPQVQLQEDHLAAAALLRGDRDTEAPERRPFSLVWHHRLRQPLIRTHPLDVGQRGLSSLSAAAGQDHPGAAPGQVDGGHLPDARVAACEGRTRTFLLFLTGFTL